MLLLRRVAVRGLASKSFAAVPATRSSVSLTTQTRSGQTQWQSNGLKRFYSDETKPSPAEEEGDQTVEAEPSAEEQRNDIVEESVATSETADARTMTDSFKSGVSRAASAVSSRIGRGSTTFGQEPPAPTKILYVGNLFFDATPDQLRDHFSHIGQIVNCKIVTDSSGLSKGFGYIEYTTLEEAKRAIEVMNEEDFEGRPLRVQYHQRRVTRPAGQESRNKPTSTLFVGNMSFQMTDKDLNDLFRSVKGVVDVRVAIDRRSGQPRGFAHVDFRSTAEATAAKSILEQKVIYGRMLRCDYGLQSVARKTPSGF